MPEEDYGFLMDEPTDEIVFDLPDDKPQSQNNDGERLRQLELDNAALRAQQQAVPRYEDNYQRPAPVQHVPQHQQQVNPELYRAQMGADLLTRPDEVLNNYSAATLNLAKNEIDKHVTPLKAGYVRQNIAFYKQTAGMDKEVAKEFDGYIKQASDAQLAALDPGSINEYLDNLHNLALGSTVRKGHIPGEIQKRVPQYNGSYQSAQPAAGRKHEKRKMSDIEKEYYRVAKNEWGYSDERIFKDLEEGLDKYENR